MPRRNAFLLGSGGGNFLASLPSKETLVRVCLFQDLTLKIQSSDTVEAFCLFIYFNAARNKKILPSKRRGGGGGIPPPVVYADQISYLLNWTHE